MSNIFMSFFVNIYEKGCIGSNNFLPCSAEMIGRFQADKHAAKIKRTRLQYQKR